MAASKPPSVSTARHFYSDPGFSGRVLRWFEQHGRHDLPWQLDPTPYRVWISEIMLQQTQVATVIPYYRRFMERFPTVGDLARAEIDQVLHLWTGLGYYARARNLHRAARLIVDDYAGEFPASVEELESLPGVGKSTAGAIAALSMNVWAPILDGNVKRVLTRYHALEGWPEQAAVKKQLWELAEQLTPQDRVDEYTQAMMDLGATVCARSNPACDRCPLSDDCQSLRHDLIEQIPGKKQRKALPVKSVRMFIFQNENDEVLLEKRPPQGIWGGLYSLPEIVLKDPLDGANEPKAGWALHTGPLAQADTAESVELPLIRHSFSHYHLDITPILSRPERQLDGVADSDRWLWYPLDHSVEVGLAAPVKKLLDRLEEPQ